MSDIQAKTCARFGAEVVRCDPQLKLGLAIATLHQSPINGLRHNPEGDTTGWYVWGGAELSDEADFFQPVCIAHLADRCPSIIPYLALPAGWRFLIAEGYEDVWFDETLLI